MIMFSCLILIVVCITQVRQLLENNDTGFVVASCRNPSEATGLLELKNKFAQRLDIQRLDVTIEKTIEVLLLSHSMVVSDIKMKLSLCQWDLIWSNFWSFLRLYLVL